MRVDQLRPGQERELARVAERLGRPVDEDAARAYLDEPANVVFVALDDTAAVGILRGTALRQLKSIRLQMFLYEIEVHPAHRRQGVGRALVNALKEYCRARPFDEIFVLTDPGNAPAVALYEATGATHETPADRLYVYRLGP